MIYLNIVVDFTSVNLVTVCRPGVGNCGPQSHCGPLPIFQWPF